MAPCMRTVLVVGAAGMGLFGWSAGCDGDDAAGPEQPQCDFGEMLDVYDRYVAPLMSDPSAQSCNACHPGNDLTRFVLATPCHTMACMIDQGLVDLGDPEHSHVLELTHMGEAADVSAAVMQNEHDRLAAWIGYCATCFEQACGQIADPCNAPPGASSGTTGSGGSGGSGSGSGGALPTGCTDDEIRTAFVSKVWYWAYEYDNPTSEDFGKCRTCHSPTGGGTGQYANEEHWLVDGDPDASLATLEGTAGMLNVTVPAASELLTKPVATKIFGTCPDCTCDENNPNQVTTAALGTITGVCHGGGRKLTPGAALEDMAAFVAYYAECKNR
jgi:hypothetical protein